MPISYEPPTIKHLQERFLSYVVAEFDCATSSDTHTGGAKLRPNR